MRRSAWACVMLAAAAACGDGGGGGDSDTDETVDAEPGIDATTTPDGAATPDASPPPPTSVLVLGDAPADGENVAAPQVIAALEGAGLDVTNGGFYAEWIAARDPMPADHDVVVWLQGETWDFALADPTLDAALADFVDAGGVLVRTEWAGYASGTYPASDALLPATYGGTYYYGGTYAAVDAGHRYLEGVTLPLVTTAGYSAMAAIDAATVIATISTNDPEPFTYPALASRTSGDGEVVYVNHDMTYTLDTIEPEILQIIVNVCDRN